MKKEKLFYLVLVVAIVNVVLTAIVFYPQIKHVMLQVEQGAKAVEAGNFIPTFHDYYYEFVFVDSQIDGPWQIDTYQEVKRLIDENGKKIKDIPTGNFEYMRYYVGDDESEVIYDLIEEDEHSHIDADHVHEEDDIHDEKHK